MSDPRIVIEGVVDNGDGWSRPEERVIAENRYNDGLVQCHKCRQPLRFMIEKGVVVGECCGYLFRAGWMS